MPSKYDPLTQYLVRVEKTTVRLQFAELEKIVGFPLPASAYRYTEWWVNHLGNPQAASWMAAGWRKTDHSWQNQWVEFIKDLSPSLGRELPPRDLPKPQPSSVDLRTTMSTFQKVGERSATWSAEILESLADFLTVSTLAGHPTPIGIESVEFLPAEHKQPKNLPPGKMAIYGFWWSGSWLKIGMVGPNSGARYTSQHYNPRGTTSSFAASLSRDPSMHSVEGFDVDEPGRWIRENTNRVNILLSVEAGLPTLALLEAFLHVRLSPRYEGRS